MMWKIIKFFRRLTARFLTYVMCKIILFIFGIFEEDCVPERLEEYLIGRLGFIMGTLDRWSGRIEDHDDIFY
jgi:hypothetical protein